MSIAHTEQSWRRRPRGFRAVCRIITILAAGLSSACGSNAPPADLPPNPGLSPNAPKDTPSKVSGKRSIEEFRAAMAPYMEKGKKTYPEAKKRFLAGLPKGYHFYVVTVLRDSAAGPSEQAFISVAAINGQQITGRIATDLIQIKKLKKGDPFTLSEKDLVDWLITHPDGTEEGNVVGKFLDEWQRTHPRQ